MWINTREIKIIIKKWKKKFDTKIKWYTVLTRVPLIIKKNDKSFQILLKIFHFVHPIWFFASRDNKAKEKGSIINMFSFIASSSWCQHTFNSDHFRFMSCRGEWRNKQITSFMFVHTPFPANETQILKGNLTAYGGAEMARKGWAEWFKWFFYQQCLETVTCTSESEGRAAIS